MIDLTHHGMCLKENTGHDNVCDAFVGLPAGRYPEVTITAARPL